MKTSLILIIRTTACFWVMSLASAQTEGVCDISNWSGSTGVIYQFDGECEYEVGQWGTPAYLEFDLEPLLDSGKHIYQMNLKCKLAELDRETGGSFRTLELVSAMGTPLIAIDFIWSHSGGTDLRRISLEGVCEGAMNEMDVPLPLAIGKRSFDHSETLLDVLIIWKPSSIQSQREDGWVELFVNGDLVGRRGGLRFGLSGGWAPRAIRYGAVAIGEPRPSGTYRFSPVSPTPYYPHF